jgi:hypothetical protein
MIRVGNKLRTFHDPIGQMSTAEIRDYINALRPYLTNPAIRAEHQGRQVLVERKIRDLETELEWRRAAHSKGKSAP